MIRSVQLSDKGDDSVSLCPDELVAYPQNVLEMLRDQDSILIDFSTRGCFHFGSFKLIITKECDEFIARLYEGRHSSLGQSIPVSTGQLVGTVTMTTKNIRDFNRFENELNLIKRSGCTTVDTYKVRSKYWNINVDDGSCSWDGIYHLRRSLFGN